MKKYVLNGKAIQSLSGFYGEVARVLSLPQYFDRNLDVLANVLTRDIEGPLEIVYPKFVISMGIGYSTCKSSRGREARSFAKAEVL